MGHKAGGGRERKLLWRTLLIFDGKSAIEMMKKKNVSEEVYLLLICLQEFCKSLN